ncbi:hypothetical protein Cni_G10392 [Canna indica]|uniref:Uncharacterized protein n=1 Tax=Canna indica TaxID=4628 RepID=A0AAQ3K4D6_9LILI|nr:hypothetical protein Cni_G10392 [Canna indica]
MGFRKNGFSCEGERNNERRSSKLISWETITKNKKYGGLGIRDLQTVRKVAMTERVLPLLNKENRKWCEMLNHQCKRWHPWMKVSGKDLSKNGKAIAGCLATLKDGLKICIGNGKNTNLWRDPWISIVPLSIWPTFIDVEELEKYAMVDELIKDRGWNDELLDTCFGNGLRRLIEECSINVAEGKDRWVWIHSKDG